jgi:serine/alanine racemase
MKKNYDSIDVSKLIAAVSIVALHADALLDINPMLNRIVCQGFGRLCVPFFFITSAYFLFTKQLTKSVLTKYCTRMIKLYVAWFIVCIPKTIFDRFICSPYLIVETSFRFLRSFFVTSTFSGSWFIVSCVFCAMLFYKLEQFQDENRRRITIAISIITYFFITFTSAYGKLIEPMGLSNIYRYYELLFADPYNSFLVGVPYFAIGRYMAKSQNAKIKKTFNVVYYTLGGGVLFLFLVAEIVITTYLQLARSTDCYLLLFPCTLWIFIGLLNCNIRIKHANFLRIESTIIFFSHFIWLYVAEFIEWYFNIVIPCAGKFLFALVGSFLTSFIIIKLSQKITILKYLY